MNKKQWKKQWGLVRHDQSIAIQNWWSDSPDRHDSKTALLCLQNRKGRSLTGIERQHYRENYSRMRLVVPLADNRHNFRGFIKDFGNFWI